jgi:hypothetical protein
MHASAHDSPFTSSTLRTSAEVTSLLPRVSTRPQCWTAEVTCLAEWIGPGSEDWRRGELEVKHSACLDLDIKRLADGGLLVSGLPGEEGRLEVPGTAIAALVAGEVPHVVVERRGRLRLTLAAEDLLPVLPAVPLQAKIVELRPRRRRAA